MNIVNKKIEFKDFNLLFLLLYVGIAFLHLNVYILHFECTCQNKSIIFGLYKLGLAEGQYTGQNIIN